MEDMWMGADKALQMCNYGPYSWNYDNKFVWVEI